MTVGIAHSAFWLIDLWPGVVTKGPNPADWTALSATEDFPLGTKRAVYDVTNKGWSTLMYVYYVKGTATLANARDICGQDTSEMATAAQWARVCNDGGEINENGPVAIALATMVEATPYCWMWVGGVCPVNLVPALDDGLYDTDGSITAGCWMTLKDSASVAKFHLGTATDFVMFSAYSMTADTTS